MKLLRSPYLRLIKNMNHVVHNFLINKVQTCSKSDMEILLYCAEAKTIESLYKRYSVAQINELIEKKMLLKENQLWSSNQIQHVEIETSTVCNWRCEFCPVHLHPRPPRYIDKDLFVHILNECKRYMYIKWISLSLYNEPSIDPNLFFYVDEIKKHGFKWILFTNGSGITKEKVSYFRDKSTLQEVIVNLPSVNPDSFKHLTGTDYLTKTCQAIMLFVQYGFSTSLSVIGRNNAENDEVEKIRLKFPNLRILNTEPCDRLGSLTNQYKQNLYLETDTLSGCPMLTERTTISIDGDIQLCCNDFHKKYKFGNLKNKSLSEILSSIEIQEIKKIVFGDKPANRDFICRFCTAMQTSINNEIYHHLP